jgi:hypothetical protein
MRLIETQLIGQVLGRPFEVYGKERPPPRFGCPGYERHFVGAAVEQGTYGGVEVVEVGGGLDHRLVPANGCLEPEIVDLCFESP